MVQLKGVGGGELKGGGGGGYKSKRSDCCFDHVGNY